MTAEGDEHDRYDWAGLVSRVVHPLKVTIVEALAWIGQPLSAHDLERVLEGQVALSLVSYHLRKLADLGVLEDVKSRQVRGATEHFYFFSEGV